MKISYATSTEKSISFTRPELVSAEDVDEYAETLRAQWKKLVESGKRIKL